MTNDISKFELFKLPVDASKNVLRSMGIGALITFSMCSNSTKSVVRSIGLTPTAVYLNIDQSVSIGFKFHRQTMKLLTLHAGPLDWNYGMSLIRFDRPLLAKLEYEKVDWRTIRLDLRGWIKHLLYILNVPKLHYVNFSTYPVQFDYQSIQTALDGLHKGLLVIGMFCDQVVPSLIISNFSSMESLVFHRTPDQSVQTLLCQNFKALLLMHDRLDDFNIKIDDLLVANSKFLFFHSRQSEREANTFLKSWINGSNPRLKYINICFLSQSQFCRNLILKGTDFTVAPEERKLVFEAQGPYDVETRMVAVRGGYDIRRKKDGTTATIKMDIYARHCYLFMYVWP